MAEFLKVAKVEELSPGQARRVEVHGKRLALFNIDGNVYALEGTCSHKDGALSLGTIAGDLPLARREAQHPNRRGAAPPARQDIAPYNVRLTVIDIEIQV